MTLSKLKQEGREKVDELFGGIYYVRESAYDSPPSDGKGNILTTDRGIREGLKTSKIKALLTTQIEKAYLSALSDVKKWTKGRNVTKDSLREVINKLKESK